METKLLFDFSAVHIPHHSRLWEGGRERTEKLKRNTEVCVCVCVCVWGADFLPNLVHTASDNAGAFGVPLESKDGSRVLD